VPLGPHAIVSALPVLGDPFSGGKAKVMSRKFFATRFAQTVAPEKVDEQYALIVPTPGKVYWDGITGAAGKITWDSKIRPPLLLIGGGVDLIADASMTRAIYNKQKKAASATELKIFEGRSHWTCSDPGWEAVADFALDWAGKHATA
jgi:pimeloyl-ACP methyl ester carboxylesterase